MDQHTIWVLLDAGYVLTVLFIFAVAVTRVMLERLMQQSSRFSLATAILFALFLIFTVYKLFSDIVSSYGINAPVKTSDTTAFGYLFGQLVLPLIFGIIYATDNIRRLMRFRAERQRLLKQLQLDALAHDHPEAAVMVEALTTILDGQSRTGLLQSIWVGAMFYVLGVVTPYIINSLAR